MADTFPDSLIIGAPKCGTTSLYHYLGGHPQIYASSQKEPHFYSYAGEERPHWGMKSVDSYIALFEGARSGQHRLEASTWYLYSDTAAEKIREYAPDTKCIALLRQPVDRAYSSWSFRVQQGWEAPSFEDAIAEEKSRIEKGDRWDVHYLNAGLYFEQVHRFYEQLGQDQVRIFLFDDFTEDAEAIVRDALSFLGLNPIPTINADTVHNPTRFPRSQALNRLRTAGNLRQVAHLILPEFVRATFRRWNQKQRPPIDPAFRKALTERVWPDVEKLERLLGIDLSRWAQ